jgi:hypothetical protein
MTLGPIIALIPWAEKAHGWASRILATFGRVPFFYYLLHIPLIHISALLINLAMTGDIHSELYGYAPFVSIAPEQRWGLPLLYIVFVGDVAILYFLCRWYSRYKANNSTNPLLKYL